MSRIREEIMASMEEILAVFWHAQQENQYFCICHAPPKQLGLNIIKVCSNNANSNKTFSNQSS
jgi:hypothetical protein